MQAGNIIVGLSSTFALIAGIFIIYITVDVAAKPLIIITRNLTSTEYAYANASFRNPVVTLGAFGEHGDTPLYAEIDLYQVVVRRTSLVQSKNAERGMKVRVFDIR